jgi:hypothetical protein
VNLRETSVYKKAHKGSAHCGGVEESQVATDWEGPG